jgi:hypothetical protein
MSEAQKQANAAQEPETPENDAIGASVSDPQDADEVGALWFFIAGFVSALVLGVFVILWLTW